MLNNLSVLMMSMQPTTTSLYTDTEYRDGIRGYTTILRHEHSGFRYVIHELLVYGISETRMLPTLVFGICPDFFRYKPSCCFFISYISLNNHTRLAVGSTLYADRLI